MRRTSLTALAAVAAAVLALTGCAANSDGDSTKAVGGLDIEVNPAGDYNEKSRDELKDDGELIVIFQPHLYSRTQHAATGLAAALDGADHAFVLDVYGAREQPVAGVSGALITDRMTSGRGEFTPTADDALARVLDVARPGDLVVTVGAGDVTHLGPRILTGLKTREGEVEG